MYILCHIHVYLKEKKCWNPWKQRDLPVYKTRISIFNIYIRDKHFIVLYFFRMNLKIYQYS